MSDTPSWLSSPTAAPAPAPVPSPLEISSPTSPSNAAASSVSDDKDLPSIILFMRLLNMGVAAGSITVALLRMIPWPRGSLSTVVLSIYGICGGLLICCLETQLKFLRVAIAVNFGFLFNSTWRFVFYFILASLNYAIGPLGKIMAYVIIGVALFNTYILCRYPAYRKIRDQIAEEEDKRIEARISKEVKKQAVKQMMKA